MAHSEEIDDLRQQLARERQLRVAAEQREAVLRSALEQAPVGRAMQDTEEHTQLTLAQLEQLYNTVTTGVRVVNRKLQVTRANQAIAQLARIPLAQATSLHCYAQLRGSSCHTDQCTMRCLERGEQPEAFESVRRLLDGTEITCVITAKPIYDSSGALEGMVEEVVDVTERRRLESIANAVDTMNNVGYIFSGIRHELGNPVNSIKMALSVLLATLEGRSEDSLRQYLGRIYEEILKIERLLGALRSYNMFERPRPAATSLRRLLETFTNVVKNDVAQRGILFDCSVPRQADRVVTDDRALTQVLLNLFSNAVDALTGRPNPRIGVSASRAGETVLLSIQDNGCGIEAERLGNLFEPFRTTKAHGTGLGLVIVRKMLTAMGASIRVSSIIGRGSTFTIVLPSSDDTTHPSPEIPAR